ncbi:hypothetical protein CCB80_07910 [Armatimonadetes bacterium Uphvl-Ar1]|nr:hypothetical protein CCB80_07910 [Armatimonadetes bacterium Uphvl-Ar1]
MKVSKLILPMLSLALVAVATAQTYTENASILSALKDTSNMRIYSPEFAFTLDKQAADPDFFINNAVFNPGSGWDNNINLFQYSAGGNLGSYILGTQITGAVSEYMRLSIAPTIDASVANGVYSFSYDIIGGATNLATDVLATLDYEVEIFDSFALSISLSTTGPVSAGQGAVTTAVLTNNTGRDAFAFTPWLGLEAGGATASMPSVFAGDFFTGSMTAGQIANTSHSTHTPDNSTPLGTYQVFAGYTGGYHSGDFLFVNPVNTTSFEVVPEPATMTILGLGALIGMRKKRK